MGLAMKNAAILATKAIFISIVGLLFGLNYPNHDYFIGFLSGGLGVLYSEYLVRKDIFYT